ncbi:hypothetical protein ACHAXN_005001 [Cyclotella atomus]
MQLLQFQLKSTSCRLTNCFRQSIRRIVTHLSPTTSLLRSNSSDNEVYLLGTAHVSDASSQEVVDLIRLVNPEVVFLELDPARAVQLRNRRDAGNNSGMEFSPFDLSKFLNGNPLFRGVQNNMANSPLSSSLEKILPVIPTFLKKLGWLPPQGGEMKAAMEEADRIGARCVYGDVEFNETISALKAAAFGLMSSPAAMMQTFSNVPPPPPELSEIFSGLMGGSKDPQQFVEDIKTRERSKTMTRYMSRCFPSIYHVMITKRDDHMARQLKKHCHKGKVVAVVGMAHVEGIEREWEKLDNVKQIS